jgi:hypothetical protein
MGKNSSVSALRQAAKFCHVAVSLALAGCGALVTVTGFLKALGEAKNGTGR